MIILSGVYKAIRKNSKTFKEMGLREKIALVLTTLAITITTTQCVPSGSRKAALQRHLETRGIKSTQSLFDNVAKVTKTTPPKRSMYKAYNFPETEYPVDSSPRDPFYYGIDPIGLAEHETSNQNFKAYNDMKKDMRMKRKMDMINENHQVSTDPEPVWLKDKDMFPEVQYPLKSMDTWVSFYGNPSVLTQNEYRHKFTELLFEKRKISEPHKEDMKIKTKLLLDEINKIQEKIASSKSHSKSDTNETQMVFQITDAVNDELWASNSTSKSSDTEDFSNQLDTKNITLICDELPMTLNTGSDDTSVISKPIPDKACEWRNETDTGGFKNKDVRLEEEPESSILLENKGSSNVQSNVSMQSIDNSTSIDNTGGNFQKVITDALIDLITTHISLKNTKKNQALVLDNTDTTCRDSDAKSAPEQEDKCSDLLPNEAQKQQGIDLTPNDDPLNVKLLLPAPSKDESMPTHVSIKNDTQTSDINKVPCSPIIVIPVGDSINKIQLPIVETTMGTPIIVFIPTTQQNNTSVTPSTNIPLTLSLISNGDSNVSFGNQPNISFVSEASQNPDALFDLSDLQQTSVKNIPINIHEIRNATSVKPVLETPTYNDTFIEKHVPVIDIISGQDNPSSVSLDHQSLTEPYPNTCVEEVASDEKIITIDQMAITEEELAKPFLFDDDTNKDANTVFTKDNSSTKLKDNIDHHNHHSLKNDLLNGDDNVSSANVPADMNKEIDVPSSKALANTPSVYNNHQLPSQNDIMKRKSYDETITDINDLATIIDEVLVKPLDNKVKVTGNVSPNETISKRPKDGMGIRNISTSEPKNNVPKVKNDNVLIGINKEDKLLKTQDADVVEKNSTILDKILKEVSNEVLADTFPEERNIKGRSLPDSTNDLLLNSTLQSNELKNINKGTPMPIKDDLEVTLLQETVIPKDKQPLSDEIVITKDTQKVEQYADATSNESDDSLNSSVNGLLEQNQLNNTRDSLVNEDFSDSLLQDTTTLDKNQDLPHLDNQSPDKNEDDLDVIKDNDFFSIPFDIKDGILLPKGMLICSGISEVPRNVKNVSLLNDEIANSQVIKQTDITNANMESSEAILPIHEVLQETPVAEMKNETITNEVRQYNELFNIEKAVSDNNKTILDTAFTNKTEYDAANVTFDRDIKASVDNTLPYPSHSNIVDNETLLSDTGANKTNSVKKNKNQRKANSKKSLKEPSDTNLSEAINESKQLTVDTASPTTPKDLTTDKKALEKLYSDSKEIQDAPTVAIKNKPPESAENDLTSAELSGLIKYLYDAV